VRLCNSTATRGHSKAFVLIVETSRVPTTSDSHVLQSGL